jgi:predicted metal-binding membrane protein
MQPRSDLSVGARQLRPSLGAPLPVVALALAAGVAWLVAIAAELSGMGALLHHHTLIEGGPLGAPPLWLAVFAALVSWQVMIVGMMVPASLPAIGVFERAVRSLPRPMLAMAGFVGAFLLAWTAIGLAAFFGDFGLHHVVDASPWLQEHESLVQVGTFALAGVYQLTPLKHRFLAACRHPFAVAAAPSADASQSSDSTALGSGGLVGLRAGWAHAVDCIGASGPLMLLMFAAGFANLAWMALLTGVMIYEALGGAGHRVAVAFGVVLIAASLIALALGGLPGFEPATGGVSG